jgi:four helix bundle protein
MRDHNLLRAFVLADELVIEIYRITKSFPKEEMYGLTSQIRRAAVSVPSNIVEGCGRETDNEYSRFLEIGFSSLKELHYQVSLAMRLGYIDEKETDLLISKFAETDRVLVALLRKLRNGRD